MSRTEADAEVFGKGILFVERKSARVEFDAEDINGKEKHWFSLIWDSKDVTTP